MQLFSITVVASHDIARVQSKHGENMSQLQFSSRAENEYVSDKHHRYCQMLEKNDSLGPTSLICSGVI